MTAASGKTCDLCGAGGKLLQADGRRVCAECRAIVDQVRNHPDRIKKIWFEHNEEPILPVTGWVRISAEEDLPDVLDGKRYRTIDREQNKWYLSVSELNGDPVEIFASTAFDRDRELQSRISTLTTITRLISLILRHVFLGEQLTLGKCLKQLQRSSRQKNDLPDMLFQILNKYDKGGAAPQPDHSPVNSAS